MLGLRQADYLTNAGQAIPDIDWYNISLLEETKLIKASLVTYDLAWVTPVWACWLVSNTHIQEA